MQTIISAKQKIINSLLLNASFIDNLGLFNGKMGISILFFLLSRKHQNKIFEDYAHELIDEIYDEISINTSTDFENGLAGIGWGIEYLVQNEFIDADTDEVLEEFDKQLTKELAINSTNEMRLLNSLLGHGYYFLKRIQKKQIGGNQNTIRLKNEQNLIHIIEEFENKLQNNPHLLMEPVFSSKFEKKSNSADLVNRKNLNEHPVFDLFWNLPSLIWFMAEIVEQEISSPKVEKVIHHLIALLLDKGNIPKQQLSKILLLASLLKLTRTFINKNNFTEASSIESIILNLREEIEKSKLSSEGFFNEMTIISGMSGILLLHEELQSILGNDFLSHDYYKDVLDQSIQKRCDVLNEIQDDNYGILTGISSPLLTSTLIE
ncbi:lanthionine synthetase LanC family protein [Draconibacterium orientale]|uniref:lanthionine synthetase LanC family protein n=1 Tax=Draconibacterium orientale TaxID=1168034 RepID=UPI0029C02DFE|nr:lanthionine synthetase LanC family protein [Draconibacterium orientale]